MQDETTPSQYKQADGAALPRLLLLDLTPTGEPSATGQLKSTLFADWPVDRLMQLHGGSRHNLGLVHAGETEGINLSFPAGRARLAEAIRAFDPDLILYRPVPNTPYLHAAAMDIAGYHHAPLVTWMVDDWPALLEIEDPAQAARLDRDLRLLLARSSAALSISAAMSDAFSARYGYPFHHVANGIDTSAWRTLASRAPNGPIRVKYAGSLHKTMSLASLLDVAAAVERLAATGLDITLEVSTRPGMADAAKELFGTLPRTSLSSAELPSEEYRSWLADADILLIGYNFDDRSRTYIRYSMSNKLPECLASGVAVLAYGPPDIATMETLADLDCTRNVFTRSEAAMDAALKTLAASPQLRAELAAKARSIAFKRFDIARIRADFVAWIAAIARSPRADAIGQNDTTTRAAIARLRVLADPWANVQPFREAIMHDVQAALRPDLTADPENILERFGAFRAGLQRSYRSDA